MVGAGIPEAAAERGCCHRDSGCGTFLQRCGASINLLGEFGRRQRGEGHDPIRSILILNASGVDSLSLNALTLIHPDPETGGVDSTVTRIASTAQSGDTDETAVVTVLNQARPCAPLKVQASAS